MVQEPVTDGATCAQCMATTKAGEWVATHWHAQAARTLRLSGVTFTSKVSGGSLRAGRHGGCSLNHGTAEWGAVAASRRFVAS